MRRTYIIAEAGVNHNGSVNTAYQLIDAAISSGADAVKFQTFDPALLASCHAKKANYQIKSAGDTQRQLEMLSSLALPQAVFKELYFYCKKLPINFLSSPFDVKSADFLINQLGLSKIKLGSGELTNAPLLYYVARSNVDVILSTGMSTLSDIEQALSVLAYGYLGGDAPTENAFREAYCTRSGQDLLAAKVSLLHCTSNYPAIPNEINLHVLNTLKLAFPCIVGYSDHSTGIGVSLGAIALGAEIIEKHFTIDKSLEGPDHQASLLPTELKQLVDEARKLENALGHSHKYPSVAEKNIALSARKSLIAGKPIIKGDRFTQQNLTTKRPGIGISPMRYWDYLGKKSVKAYAEDSILDE